MYLIIRSPAYYALGVVPPACFSLGVQPLHDSPSVTTFLLGRKWRKAIKEKQGYRLPCFLSESILEFKPVTRSGADNTDESLTLRKVYKCADRSTTKCTRSSKR